MQDGLKEMTEMVIKLQECVDVQFIMKGHHENEIQCVRRNRMCGWRMVPCLVDISRCESRGALYIIWYLHCQHSYMYTCVLHTECL